ncbi:MAG: CpaF/VirB11 family protein [Lachnospiraceae bacterium]|nr:CpaF/VirB11 family protein [Lachnospiraceae bacterium]
MLNIQDLSEIIYLNTLNNKNYFYHKNIVVAGNNSSGKSTLLKKILQTIKKDACDKFYYIDSQNRVVIEPTNNRLGICYADFNLASIISTRSDPDFFSKKDVFDQRYSGGVVTFSELMKYLDKYNRLFKVFMPNITFTKGMLFDNDTIIGGTDTIIVNGKYSISHLSSSEAAKMRLIMEINYANSLGCKAVIIDEFDDHLDSENMLLFIEKLVEYFDKIRFVFVMHNFEILVRINAMDAVIYNNETTSSTEIWPVDCDDITELGQIYKIRSQYIGKKRSNEILLSCCLSDLVKKGKISAINWQRYALLNRKDLNAKERILFDYIEEHAQDESGFTDQI